MDIKYFVDPIETSFGKLRIYNATKIDELGLGEYEKLPYSIRILLENVIRNYDAKVVNEKTIDVVAQWPKYAGKKEIPFFPVRVVMQDFTGVPVIVDLATMRDVIKDHGGDPAKVNPMIPVDLIIDHSVQVDFFGTSYSFSRNIEMEYRRNRERYLLLKWAQKTFKNFRVMPPGKGIIHQINLEYLAKVVWKGKDKHGLDSLYPDTLLGTDSHTTMINGLGVLGWGVGGIEAEAVILGQPYFMVLPEVVGVKLVGNVREGVTATDIVLYITQELRKTGVVGKFVEYFGPGIRDLSLPDRATISNMSPEYGATVGFFPIDESTINYLLGTGRDKRYVDLIINYVKIMKLWYNVEDSMPNYSRIIEIDLGDVEPSIAGPSHPEDRIPLTQSKEKIREIIEKYRKNVGTSDSVVTIKMDDKQFDIKDGMVMYAALTSCTNTSNPSLIVAAGLLAKKAVEKGLDVKPWVKTSNAPGSRVVTEIWRKLGLLPYLEALKFHITGYGCTVCIGNSGPLREEIREVIKKYRIYSATVLSGNRNFSGRIHPLARGNFLASPPLVIAYALAGNIGLDFKKEPIGKDPNGDPVYLRDIWPSSKEIKMNVEKSLDPKIYRDKYSKIDRGDKYWNSLEIEKTMTYNWDPKSTYIKKPPFFEEMEESPPELKDILKARVLVWAPDRTTTDHISPASRIPPNSKAGKYLIGRGVPPQLLNTYGSRRGNHEVMMRGSFDNPRFVNRFTPDREGGWTIYWPERRVMHIFEASERYRKEGIPLIILGGEQYGTGSSRDWAAKGPYLLGVKAVIAESFERIHRSNLVGMGILPLEFLPNENADKLGLDGSEIYDIYGIEEGLYPGKLLRAVALKENGKKIDFKVKIRLDMPIEVDYYRHGGILKYVLRNILRETKSNTKKIKNRK